MVASMTVSIHDIMTPNVLTVSVDMTTENAARMLFARGVSGMPVVDDSGLLVGVVTEYDIIARSGQTVGDIMTRDVVTVTEDSDAETVAAILTTRKVRRLPVVRDGRVIGIISRADLVRLFAMTRWSCESCGYYTRGFERLNACPKCGSARILLEREPPGS